MIVADYPQQAACSWPNATAIIDGKRRVSFLELNEEIKKAALSLRAVGVKAGSGVGIEAPDCAEFVIAVFAALSCGATVLPLSPTLTDHELMDTCQKMGLHTLLLSRDFSDKLQSAAQLRDLEIGCRSYQCVTDLNQNYPFIEQIADPAFIRFTSGTTGASKGVLVSHQAVDARTAAARTALGLESGDTVVWVLPMAYHFIVSLVMYVRYGITIAIADAAHPDSIVKIVKDSSRSFLYAAPDHYRQLSNLENAEPLPSLFCAISTSSSLSKTVAEKFYSRYRTPVSQVYGIIELGLPAGNLTAADRSDSIGKVFPGYSVAILDESGDEVQPGNTGQLAFKGPGMFDAYLYPFRPRNEILKNGWFLTGDTAWIDENGYITIEGRNSSVIHIEDKKVFPEEVEHIINAHPGVISSRVFGDKRAESEKIVAEVISSSSGLNPEELRNYCLQKLASWKVPYEFRFVTSLKLTRTGKLLRQPTESTSLAA